MCYVVGFHFQWCHKHNQIFHLSFLTLLCNIGYFCKAFHSVLIFILIHCSKLSYIFLIFPHTSCMHTRKWTPLSLPGQARFDVCHKIAWYLLSAIYGEMERQIERFLILKSWLHLWNGCQGIYLEDLGEPCRKISIMALNSGNFNSQARHVKIKKVKCLILVILYISVHLFF